MSARIPAVTLYSFNIDLLLFQQRDHASVSGKEGPSENAASHLPSPAVSSDGMSTAFRLSYNRLVFALVNLTCSNAIS